MKEINAHIQFEVQTQMQPLQALASGFDADSSDTESGYQEATEEDINMLARALGG